MNDHPLVGTYQLVFDSNAWLAAGYRPGSNAQFWKRAKILAVDHPHKDSEATATIAWEATQKISRGHYISYMNGGRGAGEFVGIVKDGMKEYTTIEEWKEQERWIDGSIAASEATHHPSPTQQPKLSTNFTNPSLQLRWEIEGVAHIEVEQTMQANRYNIASLYVDPQYQNLGIGTALMNIVLHEADLVGIELWLVPQAMPGMEENLHNFYMRFGFEDLGQSGYMIRKSPTAEPE